MCHVGPPSDIHLTLVEPDELPNGQEWMFVELGGELYSMLSKEASAEGMMRGLTVARGLGAELTERKRLADMGGSEGTSLPLPPMLIS